MASTAPIANASPIKSANITAPATNAPVKGAPASDFADMLAALQPGTPTAKASANTTPANTTPVTADSGAPSSDGTNGAQTQTVSAAQSDAQPVPDTSAQMPAPADAPVDVPGTQTASAGKPDPSAVKTDKNKPAEKPDDKSAAPTAGPTAPVIDPSLLAVQTPVPPPLPTASATPANADDSDEDATSVAAAGASATAGAARPAAPSAKAPAPPPVQDDTAPGAETAPGTTAKPATASSIQAALKAGRDGNAGDAAKTDAKAVAADAQTQPVTQAQTATQTAAPSSATHAAALAGNVTQPAPASGAPTANAQVQVTPQAQATPDMPALAVQISAKSQSGAKQFDIRLDPPELGRVEVRLSIDATGKASAHLTADQPQTLDLLQKDSTNLTRALRDAGLDVAQNGLAFSLKSGSQGNGQASRNSSGARTTMLSATKTIDAAPSPAAFRSFAGDARLDIHV